MLETLTSHSIATLAGEVQDIDTEWTHKAEVADHEV